MQCLIFPKISAVLNYGLFIAFKAKRVNMKYKGLIIIGFIGLFTISAVNAQAKPQNTDSLKREDSLRKDRAAQADVYVAGKNIMTHEPTKVDSSGAIKKALVKRKRKFCRKNGQ